MATIDFEAVTKDLVPKLLRKATALCSNNHTFAEEAVQETLVSAWKHQEQFDGKNLGGWLHTILRNKIIDARRPKRCNSFLHNSIMLDNDGGMMEEHKALTTPAYEPEKMDVAAIVAKTIETLPAQYSEILKLRILDELPQKEVAARLGLPVGTIMSRSFRVMPTLKKRLKDALDEGR